MMSLRNCLVALCWCCAGALVPFRASAAEGVPATDWDAFLAKAEFADVFAAYGALEGVGYGVDSVDAEACAARAADLDSALAVVPVSIALHHAAMLCAEAMGDDARADSELAVLAAQATGALSLAVHSEDPRPIRVVHPIDALAMLRIARLEVSYAYYRHILPGRGLPYTIATWDANGNVERHFTFDYVDTAARINRKDTYSGYPVDRFLIGTAFRDQFAKKGDVASIDAKALHEARTIGDVHERIARLRKAAGLGGVLSVAGWIGGCSLEPFDGCSDGLVDALLPQAEAHHALAMMQLAYLYESGIGIARDPDPAQALVKAADERWPEHAASVNFASLWNDLRPADPYPDWLGRRLAEAEAAGSTDARVVTVRKKLAATPDVELDDADIAALAAESSNGSGAGARTLANYYSRRKDEPAALEWTRKAAEHGDASAQADLAWELLFGDKAHRDEVGGKRWMEAAAQGGNAWAQRYMAGEAESAGKWADARKWLLAGAMTFDLDSILELASLMEWERPGAEGTPADALSTYRDIAAANVEPQSAEARRRMAEMALAGRGMDKDPAHAREWLMQDAKAGDMKSAARLGMAYLGGEFGKADEATGRRWIDKAIAAGEPVRADLGWWLYFRKGDAASKQEALRLWREGIANEEFGASNNLAWVLCTSPDPVIADGKAGVDVARKMATRDLPPGYLDTVAACHAAVGEFDQAIAVQQEALDRVVAQGFEEDAANFRARLALYRDRRPYVETKAP